MGHWNRGWLPVSGASKGIDSFFVSPLFFFCAKIKGGSDSYRANEGRMASLTVLCRRLETLVSRGRHRSSLRNHYPSEELCGYLFVLVKGLERKGSEDGGKR